MDAPPDPALEVARAVVAVMLWNIHRKEEMKQHLRRLTSIEPEEIYFQATHLGGKNWALVRCANLQDAHAVIAAVNAQPLQEGKARRWPPSYPIAQVIARKSRGIFSSDIEIDDLVDYIESMYGHRAVGAAVSRNRGKVVLQMESEEAAKEVIQLGARQRTSDGDVLSFEVAVPFWRFI
ncbi:uncharacterized protein JCM10292_004208 [Rhodotorula paludigena]|uniref:uncharacterized protein n=1 Tax=Rhodotorula paludigena TaxID=86838 RepID=UPI003182B8C6